LGRRDGVLTGVELAVYREGRELKHPRTGEVLGCTEQALGRMVVRQVFEAYSTCELVEGSDVKPGDEARVSAGKVKLTVLPLVEGVRDGLVEAASQELVEALARTGRFQVGMGDALGVSLAQAGVKRQEALEGKGLAGPAARLKVENLLLVSFTREQGKPYMDVRLFGFPGTSNLLTTAMFVPSQIRATPRNEQFSAGRPRDNQTAIPKRSLLARLLTGELDAGAYSAGEQSIPLKEVAKFPYVIVSMDVAVSPVDKITRVVLTEGEKVYLYRLTQEGALEPEWTYSAGARGRIFGVQLADLDGDGRFEVVANRYNPNPSILLTSFILGQKDGKPVVLVDDVGEILYAVDAAGDGIKKTLWMQPFQTNGFFKAGDVTRVRLAKGKLVPEARVRVPSNFRATGATFSNISGKTTRALAYIDEFNRMRITLESEDLWRSSSPLGTGMPKLEVVTMIERGGRSFIYEPQPMPVSVDLDGDGVEEIVAPQNQLPGRLAVIYKGPAGFRFQTVNSGFEGTVMALGAVHNEGASPTLVVAVGRYYGLLGQTGETALIITTGE
ncbi:MAG: FG-GAP repeat domain-containing protein, partial [Candidatus Rokuibacteriota bacterium]